MTTTAKAADNGSTTTTEKTEKTSLRSVSTAWTGSARTSATA